MNTASELFPHAEVLRLALPMPGRSSSLARRVLFMAGTPGCLDSAIDRIEGDPADGDIIDLVADNGKFVARGVYNSASRIRVRLYTWTPAEALDEAFWDAASAGRSTFREQLGYDDPQGAARLVFSEADGVERLDRRSLRAVAVGADYRSGDSRPSST